LLPFSRQAPVVLVVPFPKHRLLQLQPVFPPIDIFQPPPPVFSNKGVTTVLVAHFDDKNALFCQQFISHHAAMFDLAVVIDLTTSTAVRDTFESTAPSSWRWTNRSNIIMSSLFSTLPQQLPLRVLYLEAHRLLVHTDIRSFISNFAGLSLYFPVVRISESSISSLAGNCLHALCHRAIALVDDNPTYVRFAVV
jgi:hypothetical protein